MLFEEQREKEQESQQRKPSGCDVKLEEEERRIK
jgi:hypothetical protein